MRTSKRILVFLALLLFPGLSQAQNVQIPPSAIGVAPVGQIPASQTAAAPCANCVGFKVSASTARGSGPTLTSGTTTNLNSIVLAPGNWVIYWSTSASAPTTTFTQIGGGIAATNNGFPTIPTDGQISAVTSSSDLSISSTAFRSLSVSTTIFLNVQVLTSASGTGTGYGWITAVRQ